MIRKANITDIDKIVELTMVYFSSFLEQNGVTPCEVDVRQTAIQGIVEGRALVVEHDGEVQGVIGWVTQPHPANKDIIIMSECLWCVKSSCKTDTLAMMRAFEKEAEKTGADVILVSALLDNKDQMARIFHKRGFHFVETMYSKKIGV